MVFPVVGGNESKGYEISNSLRFNDGDSPELYKTLGSPTNNKIYTFSMWLKRSDVTATPNSQGDSGRTRTYDQLLRRQLLYPTELLSQC